jgi:hypothetical protein
MSSKVEKSDKFEGKEELTTESKQNIKNQLRQR